MNTTPFAIDDIKQHYPAWPYSKWTTWQFIRDGHLKAMRPPGRRVFVSVALLEEFLAQNTTAKKKRPAKRKQDTLEQAWARATTDERREFLDAIGIDELILLSGAHGGVPQW